MKHSIQKTKLKNGVEGLLIDVPDATVMGLELNFRAGDFRSPKGKWEAAHVLEHMVFGANKDFPKSRLFQAELQKNGAFMNASTSAYNLNYIIECADFEWDRILDLTKLSVESPLLSEDEFKAELGNVREELVGDLNHNFRQVLIRARENFGLVALDDRQRIEQLANLKVGDVRKFYEDTHHAGNLRFIISGDISNRHKQIEKIFSDIELPEGERVSMPDETPAKYKDVHYIEKPDLQNIYFFFESFARNSLDQRQDDALNMVNVMLTATLHSRILGEARERGLAYHISSNFTKLKDSTGWWFGAELTPENAEPVFEIITREIKRIQDGKLDAEDLEAAKQYSLGRYQRSAQTVSGILGGYSGGYFFDGRVEDYFGYPERIKALKKSDIVDIVRLLFKDDTWGLTVMGTDKKQLAEQLNSLIQPLWG